MKYRRFGRTGWQVSEIGYGMWGLAGWKGHDDKEVLLALDRSAELGCNFYDTAWGYGEGRSEKILGDLLKRNPSKTIHFATKIPPKNFKWPSKPHYPLEETFPYDHIIEYTERSLGNLDVDCIDLMQFHVWEDNWSGHDDWKRAVLKLKEDGKVRYFGISVNRWEPDNVLETLKTGLIDSVQVIYNIFDQAPEDRLFPLCRKLDIATIARVPFDEGTLTGTFTNETRFDPDDWRSTYFVEENLTSSVAHADALKPLVPEKMTMAEMALRFILSNPDVSTIIPGMRRMKNVNMNIGVSDSMGLDEELLAKLKDHRWDRVPTEWSQ